MTEQEQLGYLIRELRTRKGLTQQEFADMLKTSQSAVARMEAGQQNFSVKELAKISEALGHPLVNISENQTDDLIINGGKQLSGSIQTNPSKNGAMGLLCASLLNKGTTTLHNIPRIEEVFRMIEVMESMDIKIEWIEDHTLRIKPPTTFNTAALSDGSARVMRSTIMLIGSLSHSEPTYRLPHAGGCKMGARTIAAHKHGLEAFGITITTEEEYYQIDASKISAGTCTMYEASDTGTENVLMAAAGIEDTSYIRFAQENYMVQDVIGFLRRLGVVIERHDPITLMVKGTGLVDMNIEYWNSEDPIESMAFITAGIMTKSPITITRCPIDFLRLELLKLETMGLGYTTGGEYLAENGFTKLVDITLKSFDLTALPDKIHPLPYPGINVDNLPFFVPIATQATGQTLIHDWMWENRAIYFTELNRLGADIRLADPHRVFANGPTPLRATQIVCPPALRPSMIIFLAMLAAPGTSTLRNVYAIKRGYENIAERLNKLGADIQSVNNLS